MCDREPSYNERPISDGASSTLMVEDTAQRLLVERQLQVGLAVFSDFTALTDCTVNAFCADEAGSQTT